MRTPRFAVVACAVLASGCFLPHVVRTHPAVHGVVLENGVPVAGVVVSRCIDGCEEIEQVVTDAGGLFALPVHHAFGLLILPVPYDPISDFGFDLQVGDRVYCGRGRGGIGAPPARYTASCELAGALPKPHRRPPGLGDEKPTCTVELLEK
jgi:hypothetical protein